MRGHTTELRAWWSTSARCGDTWYGCADKQLCIYLCRHLHHVWIQKKLHISCVCTISMDCALKRCAVLLEKINCHLKVQNKLVFACIPVPNLSFPVLFLGGRGRDHWRQFLKSTTG